MAQDETRDEESIDQEFVEDEDDAFEDEEDSTGDEDEYD